VTEFAAHTGGRDSSSADIAIRTGYGQTEEASLPAGLGKFLENSAFWLLIATLAWAPFPLGSNRPWAWSALALLVACCWGVWVASGAPMRVERRVLRRLWPPALLVALCLVWGVFQAVPLLSLGPSREIWAETLGVLGGGPSSPISLYPWQTLDEVIKLATYVMAACLACALCLNPARANVMLNAIIAIGAAYALYAFALHARGILQFEFFYAAHAIGDPHAGPFVNRNSYATYAGLIALSATARAAEFATRDAAFSRGARLSALALLQFVAGPGMLALLALVLSLTALIATGSRAGFASFLLGISFLTVLLALSSTRGIGSARAILGLSAFGLIVLGAVAISGESLLINFNRLTESEDALGLRRTLWLAAWEMIRDAPLTGFGLGSYESAFPLYADELRRVTVDKAHNDFLEFAAGFGLPAAILWWAAMLWLLWYCVRALFVRRQQRLYPLVAVGSTVLVAAHALFDFSLQMPAIALTYSVIFALGIAQSFSLREK